jgi:two-component system, NarL family, response regulator YdfI
LIQVAVVAPNLALRAGLRSLLGAAGSLEVAGEASDLSQIIEILPGIDVIVYAVPGLTEVGALAMLQESLSEGEAHPAVLLLIDDLNTSAVHNLPYPAWGLLPMDTTPEELSAAVNALHEGLLVGAPHLMEAVFLAPSLTDKRQELGPLEGPQEPLTLRESEVLQLLAQGLANKQIAVLLGISEHTVKFHVSSIHSKLGASSRTEAVSIGARLGLVVL